MNKGDVLFYICEECGHYQIIPQDNEYLLQWVYAIICGDCQHEHTDIQNIKYYSKATRRYEEL